MIKSLLLLIIVSRIVFSAYPVIPGCAAITPVVLKPSDVYTTVDAYTLVIDASKFPESWWSGVTSVNDVCVYDPVGDTLLPRYIDDFSKTNHTGFIAVNAVGNTTTEDTLFVCVVPSMLYTNSPLAYTGSGIYQSYAFSEGSGNFTDRNSTHTGVDNGVISRSKPGVLGYSCSTGISSYINTGSLTELNSAEKRSFQFVCSKSDFSAGGTIFRIGATDFITLYTTASRIDFTTKVGAVTSTTRCSTRSTYMPTGDYFLITVVYDGTQTDGTIAIQNAKRVRIYVNDIMVPTATYTGDVPATLSGTLSAGAGNIGYTTNSWSDGKLDEARIFNVALDSNSVVLTYKNIFMSDSVYSVGTTAAYPPLVIQVLGQSNASRMVNDTNIQELRGIIDTALVGEKYVKIISKTVSGTGLVAGSANLWSDRGSGTYFQTAVDIAINSGQVDYCVWYQGEADASSQTVTKAEYKAAFTTLVGDYKTATSYSPVFLIVQVRSGYATSIDPYFWQVKLAQCELENGTDVFVGAVAEGLPGGEGSEFIHLTNESIVRVNRQIGDAINYFEDKNSHFPPLHIVSAEMLSNRDSIIVGLSTDIQSDTNFIRFNVYNGSTQLPILSSVRSSDSTLKIALDGVADSNIVSITWGESQTPNDSTPFVPHDTGGVFSTMLGEVFLIDRIIVDLDPPYSCSLGVQCTLFVTHDADSIRWQIYKSGSWQDTVSNYDTLFRTFYYADRNDSVRAVAYYGGLPADTSTPAWFILQWDDVATSAVVYPSNVTIGVLKTRQFTVTFYDLTGTTTDNHDAVVWSTSASGETEGSIDETSGLFTSGTAVGGPYTVTATAGAISDDATITVAHIVPSLKRFMSRFNLNFRLRR